MPTPFMHLHAAHRFFADHNVPLEIRVELRNYLGAFLLGNVAPDARVSSGLNRADTHFFEYQAQVTPHPQQALLNAYPELNLSSGNQRAFVAGYLAHLAMDVVWAEDMLFPYFYEKKWADRHRRYVMLHVLLCYLDARDYRQWDAGFGAALAAAQPQDWAAFLPDDDLAAWRDIIARQICTDCASETVAILGGRVSIGADGLQNLLDDPAQMQEELWQHVPPRAVETVEQSMYQAMVKYLIAYMTEQKP